MVSGMKEWSSRQGCEFSGVKVPAPSITCFGRLAYPGRAEATKHDVLGRKVTNRPAGNCSGGSDQGGKQTERPEHNEMAATSKIPSAVKSLERNFTVRRPIALMGKADAAGEVTGKSNLQTVVVGGPGILGKTRRDNVGKGLLPAGAGSNLQRS